jgi:hypothetical protein
VFHFVEKLQVVTRLLRGLHKLLFIVVLTLFLVVKRGKWDVNRSILDNKLQIMYCVFPISSVGAHI